MRKAFGTARRTPAANRAGFTVVELLIAALIMGVVLSIASSFLIRQNAINRRVHAQAEVQDKVRMVMQIVGRDLALAGASVYADGSGTLRTTGATLASCPVISGVSTCLHAANGAGGTSHTDELAMAYVTTLYQPADACREVGYRFNSANLERIDRDCSGGLPSDGATGFDTLATNVDALDIKYLCSNGAVLDNVPDTTGACPVGEAYIRSAIVAVVAHSDITIPGANEQTFTLHANSGGTTATVVCGPDVVCASLTQEFMLPNLKDR